MRKKGESQDNKKRRRIQCNSHVSPFFIINFLSFFLDYIRNYYYVMDDVIGTFYHPINISKDFFLTTSLTIFSPYIGKIFQKLYKKGVKKGTNTHTTTKKF